MNEHPTPDSTRREDVPARQIRLADGQEWGFTRPTVRLTPVVVTELDRIGRPVERVTVEIGFGYPLDVQQCINVVQSACERVSVPDQYDAFFSLAVLLLQRAHEISLTTACNLLSVSGEDLPRLVREVLAIVVEVNSTAEERVGTARLPRYVEGS